MKCERPWIDADNLEKLVSFYEKRLTERMNDGLDSIVHAVIKDLLKNLKGASDRTINNQIKKENEKLKEELRMLKESQLPNAKAVGFPRKIKLL